MSKGNSGFKGLLDKLSFAKVLRYNFLILDSRSKVRKPIVYFLMS